MKNLPIPEEAADNPAPADVYNFTVAAGEGDAEVVSLFLKRWPHHVDSKDDKGWTAIMCAARTGQENIVALLLRHGANPAVTDRFDRTARWFAKRGGYAAIAALLRDTMKQ